MFNPDEAPLALRHFSQNGVIQEYLVNPMLLKLISLAFSWLVQIATLLASSLQEYPEGVWLNQKIKSDGCDACRYCFASYFWLR